MSGIIGANFGLTKYIKAAQSAVLTAPNMVTVWDIAEYLDLVEAKELPANVALVRECRSVVNRFVMTHLANGAYVSFWERAGCLFRAYKKALNVAERALNEHAALQA